MELLKRSLSLFLAGLLLCNCIPHLTAGLRGEPFPTPFAKPRGVGLSSPTVNFLWGTANLAGSAWLAGILFSPQGLVLGGFAAAGIYLSTHFGRVRNGARPAAAAPQYWSELIESMNRMHTAVMSLEACGNEDEDFVKLMLPHHQAAIDMAKTELRHGKDSQMRRLAQEIITDQQAEIELMRLWLNQQHGK